MIAVIDIVSGIFLVIFKKIFFFYNILVLFNISIQCGQCLFPWTEIKVIIVNKWNRICMFYVTLFFDTMNEIIHCPGLCTQKGSWVLVICSFVLPLCSFIVTDLLSCSCSTCSIKYLLNPELKINVENVYWHWNFLHIYDRHYLFQIVISHASLIFSNQLQKQKLPGVYVMPSAQSPLVWNGLLFLRQGLYESCSLRFILTIPDNYPDGDCPVSNSVYYLFILFFVIYSFTFFEPFLLLDILNTE